LSLGNQKLFYGVLTLALACIWVTPYLPSVDIPQHTAQIVTLQELAGGNPLFSETFELNWFAPYTATYLLVYLLALVMPVTVATKVLVTLVVAAIPLLSGRLLEEVGAYPGWKWLTIPAGFGVAFHWGFLPFMVAAPVGLYLLLLTIRFERAPTLVAGINVAIVTALLFFFHVIALGFAALLCLGYIAAARYREPAQVVRLWLPYTAGLPLLLYWYLSTLGSESYVQGAAVVYGPVFDRIIGILSQPAGLGALSVYASALLVAGLLAFPFLSGARLSDRPELRALPVVALVVLFAMPATAFGSIFLYQRLTIFLLPVYLLAWKYPAGVKPKLEGAVLAVVGLLALANVARFAAFGAEMRNLSAVIEQTEPGKKLMYFPVIPVTAGFGEPVHFHSGAWYQAEKRGIVDFNFAFFFPSMVRFREGQHTWVPNDSVVWQPMQFEWERSNGEFYDYFLAHSLDDAQDALFKADQNKVELVARQGWWWLYKKAAPQAE
jgi:hypothetical protein